MQARITLSMLACEWRTVDLSSTRQLFDLTCRACVCVGRADVADCSTSVHHKVNKNTEVGLSTSYNLHTSNVALNVVGKYVLSDGAIVKVRCSSVDVTVMIGLCVLCTG